MQKLTSALKGVCYRARHMTPLLPGSRPQTRRQGQRGKHGRSGFPPEYAVSMTTLNWAT